MSEEVVQTLLAIALAVVSGGISIATYYLKKKWSLADRQQAVEIIDAAVRAAEIMGAALGWDADAKKAWVIDKVSEQIKIPPDQLQMFVEASVARLKAAKEELVKRGDAVVVKT